MDLQKITRGISSLRQRIEKKQAAIDKDEEKLAQKLRALSDVCKPICEMAAREYNLSSSSLLIVIDNLRLSFHTKEGVLGFNLSTRLSWLGGHEPDEDCDFDEINRVSSRLRPILNKELEKAGMPLFFGNISVPNGYYPK
ncbi:MAG TPA: hypothetical protein VMV62_00020 [Candidatus Paceibacterota bacterium]|nr:hypothetical protein [Candidatus Paceibacterota bacterium]